MNSICSLAISILLENNINTLPVDVKNLNIHGNSVMFSNYDKSSTLIEGTQLQRIMNENSALTVSKDGKYCVLLNPALGATQRHEKIAHELGHIACEHEGTDGFCGVTDDCAQKIIQEAEAEQFKTELLAPTILLCKMGANSTERIQAITGVSEETAEKALVAVLHRNGLKNPFLTEDEERLWENFKAGMPEKSNSTEQPLPEEPSEKHWYNAIIAVVSIAILFLVMLDCKIDFLDKGDYVAPQDRQTLPLTPDYGTNPYSYTVYVTAHGKKYHRATCRYLTESQRDIDL